MASGDPVLESLQVIPPGATFATFDVRPGGSTPSESVAVYDFDAVAVEYLDFQCRLAPGYAGGGLTLKLSWSASTATTGDVRWEAAIRRIEETAEDIDAAHSYAFNGVTDSAPSTSGEVAGAAIAFTNGADMDSLAAGELFILRCRRLASDGGDTMAGDAELWANEIALRET